MNREQQIQLFLDDELPEKEHAAFVAAMEQDDSLANEVAEFASMAELHATSAPEPKDTLFIEKELTAIKSQIHEQAQEADEKIITFPTRWLAYSVGVAAALALTWTLWVKQGTNLYSPTPSMSSVEFVETDIEGASTTVYTDEQSGWTFVWMDEEEVG
jgi:hypothetical protein